MIEIWKDVYRTYAGDSEPHGIRLSVMALTALFVGIYSSNLPDRVFEVMSLAISVLAGFSFTALFSDHAITTSNLPLPKDETDRNDMQTLKTLGDNFRKRTRFFIVISVIDLLFILILSISFSFSESIFLDYGVIINFQSKIDLLSMSVAIFNILKIMINFLVIFIFLECLYTFYRLTETILSILNMRSNYLENR